MTFDYRGKHSTLSYWRLTDDPPPDGTRWTEDAFVRWVDTESLIGKTRRQLLKA